MPSERTPEATRLRTRCSGGARPISQRRTAQREAAQTVGASGLGHDDPGSHLRAFLRQRLVGPGQANPASQMGESFLAPYDVRHAASALVYPGLGRKANLPSPRWTCGSGLLRHVYLFNAFGNRSLGRAAESTRRSLKANPHIQVNSYRSASLFSGWRNLLHALPGPREVSGCAAAPRVSISQPLDTQEHLGQAHSVPRLRTSQLT
jgi:hypothetical protein